jgi:polyisoprenoid-binding protein YceI
MLDRPCTSITIVARSAFTKVRASFQDVDGGGYFDADDPSRSRLELTIQARSIESRNARRDAHLRSDAYLDVAEHPQITFVSTAVTRLDHQHYAVIGDLTVHGVTKPVTVQFTLTTVAPDSFGRQRIELQGSADLDRSQWGVTWNRVVEGGGIFVSRKVTAVFKACAVCTSTASQGCVA